jgi:predicted dinucleotide-binding enzyme
MNIGVLGTGFVGQTIGTALLEKRHRVMIGSRTANNEKAIVWIDKKENAFADTFEEAARFADIIFLCINGAFIKETIAAMDAALFKDKIIIDVSNPLDFSKGMPASILPTYSNRWSLGEEIQQLLPDALVVKALNTVTAKLMVNAELVNEGNHQMCICGNDTDAKNKVKHLLAENFLWKPEFILDMGGIESARLMEAVVPYWLGVMQVLGTPLFNYQIVK